VASRNGPRRSLACALDALPAVRLHVDRAAIRMVRAELAPPSGTARSVSFLAGRSLAQHRHNSRTARCDLPDIAAGTYRSVVRWPRSDRAARCRGVLPPLLPARRRADAHAAAAARCPGDIRFADGEGDVAVNSNLR